MIRVIELKGFACFSQVFCFITAIVPPMLKLRISGVINIVISVRNLFFISYFEVQKVRSTKNQEKSLEAFFE
jgi:hypothetical protein